MRSGKLGNSAIGRETTTMQENYDAFEETSISECCDSNQGYTFMCCDFQSPGYIQYCEKVFSPIKKLLIAQTKMTKVGLYDDFIY